MIGKFVLMKLCFQSELCVLEAPIYNLVTQGVVEDRRSQQEEMFG